MRRCSSTTEKKVQLHVKDDLRRESWKMLLLEQGYEQPCIAGKGCEVPWLLSRQSVVMGLSDGLILAQPAVLVPRTLDGHPASLPHELAASFVQTPLRNSLPQGGVPSTLLIRISPATQLTHLWMPL